MKVYFEDGQLLPQSMLPFKYNYKIDAANIYGVACWEQYLKYRHCKDEMEAKEE